MSEGLSGMSNISMPDAVRHQQGLSTPSTHMPRHMHGSVDILPGAHGHVNILSSAHGSVRVAQHSYYVFHQAQTAISFQR
jgi:hypothetical protein